jgi:hypothetical protein
MRQGRAESGNHAERMPAQTRPSCFVTEKIVITGRTTTGRVAPVKPGADSWFGKLPSSEALLRALAENRDA